MCIRDRCKASIPTAQLETKDPYHMCEVQLLLFRGQGTDPGLVASKDFTIELLDESRPGETKLSFGLLSTD